MKYLLDTPVVSELIKRSPCLPVVHWLDEQEEENLFLSVLTIGELQKGISKLADTARRRKLQAWVESHLCPRFQKRLLPLDLGVAIVWGTLQGTCEQRGQPLPAIDSLIAATALAHALVVVTRNTTDLQRCQVPVFNPWLA